MRVIVCDTGLLVAAALSGGCAGTAGILVSSWPVKTRPGGYRRTAAAAHTTSGRGLALARRRFAYHALAPHAPTAARALARWYDGIQGRLLAAGGQSR
jgi:hypothetical protein